MKTSSVIVGFVVLVFVGILYLNVTEKLGQQESRLVELEQRVVAAEGALVPLDPLAKILKGARSRLGEGAYEAKQAVGLPNVPGGEGDDALAWCPANEDEGMEWLHLEYAEEVRAVEVRVYANFNPGAVTKILRGEVELASQVSLATEFSGQVFVLSDPRAIKELKLVIDTAKVPGWNEIDAVALVDAAGVTHWAVKAEASSVWKRE